MLVEKIIAASFLNGILRLETASVNAQGKLTASGSIEIPGNQVSNVINEISDGAQQISAKLASVDEKPKEADKAKSKKGKDSSKNKAN
tara:strand:- start:1726 stop:1989 length:264 start_codon:yes stop_codon:yes gene_type:complete